MERIHRNDVLKALKAAGGRSLHLMEVVQGLEAPKSAKDAVRAVLLQLVEAGFAKELPGNRFKVGEPPRHAAPPPPAVPSLRTKRRPTDRLTGRSLPSVPETGTPVRNRSVSTPAENERLGGWLTMTTRGFGFVTTDDGGPDVFVAPSLLGAALHGDRVELDVRPSDKGREGRVVRVLERGILRIAGKLVRARRGFDARVLAERTADGSARPGHGRERAAQRAVQFGIEPSDPRLPAYVEVDGELPLETRPGQDVVAQITHHPRGGDDTMRARVLRALPPRGSANGELEKVRIREGVNEEFPDAVTQEALGFPADVHPHDLEGREDFRTLDLCTIDPEDARDHDDAIWATRLPGGGFRVVVAIADVSHYVRENTAIDREAVTRGCSIYLPDRAIPMLPPELSSNLASLLPNVDRLALAVDVELASDGAILDYRFVEARMKSRARLTYGGVARALGWSETSAESPGANERLPLLETLRDISAKLRAKRVKRGALGFELPEPKVKLDEKGEPVDVFRQKGDPGVKRAYEVVEDFMLLANEIVAGDLSRRGIPTLYRLHGAPEPAKMAEFASVAEAFGKKIDLGEDDRPTPKQLADLLVEIRGTPLETPLGYLLLRSMQQATYGVKNIGHFALAARDYLHFTSPIRRYPDLVVHRIVRSVIRHERIDTEKLHRTLVPIGVASGRAERRAVTIEREAIAIHRAILMKDRVGEELPGRVSGISEPVLFVTLDEPFVEVRVPVERISGDRFELDRLGVRLVGAKTKRAFALGDPLLVRIEEVSVERREIVGCPAATPSAPRAERPAGTDHRAKATHHRAPKEKTTKKSSRVPQRKHETRSKKVRAREK
jgi:ribonuclease R